MKREIVLNPNDFLRKVSKPITIGEIKSTNIQKIVDDLIDTLDDADNGVALSAPQIAENIRIFVVSSKAFEYAAELEGKEFDKTKKVHNLVFINPEIIKRSKKESWMEEGCLSLPNIFGEVKRSEKVSVKAYDREGKPFTYNGSGLFSQIFQHEIDHLDGVLFIDKARNIRNDNVIEESNLAFFGTDDFAVFALEEMKTLGVIPRLIVTTPDKPKGRGMKLTPSPVCVWAEKNNISVYKPESLKKEEVEKYLRQNIWDIFLIASYGKIIPKNIIDIPTFGTLNIHPSLLPKYRGASPIESAILDDQKETGVSLMLIDEQMDHGPIISQEKHSFDEWPNKREVERILAEKGAELFVNAIKNLAHNKIQIKEQIHDEATYTRKITKEDGLIDKDDNTRSVFLKIKALSGWPGAYIVHEHKGKKMRVVLNDAEWNGNLQITKVTPEGKQTMDYESFKRGYGDVLSSPSL